MISAAAARRIRTVLDATKPSAWETVRPSARSSSTAAASTSRRRDGHLYPRTSHRHRAFASRSDPIEVTLASSPSEQHQRRQHREEQPRSKSSDQRTEEEILRLQSALRAHHRSASYPSALQVARSLLRLNLEHFGKMHPATASAYNNVGLMNKCLGNYEEAKEAYEEALRVYGEVCGKDHGSYAAALSNLGMLERGRVLEPDNEEDDDAGAGDGAQDSNRDDRATIPQNKNKLSTLDRLQLNEASIEYFDEAHRIRLAELGPTHPHTLSSRSQLGSAMAYSVIMERRSKLSSASSRGLIEEELRSVKEALKIRSEEEMEKHIPQAVARAASKSMEGSKLSKRRWEAAEEHLRGALEGAVGDPRGERVEPLEFLPGGGGNGGGAASGKGLFVKDRSLSKKDRRRAAKDAKREKRAIANALQVTADNHTTIKIPIQGPAQKVTTLSAATTAQNLAVFLKNYSDWLQMSLLDAAQQNQEERRRQLRSVLSEARHLYEAALHVRSRLLPAHHPDVISTKFSLAELLDAPRDGASSSGGASETEDGERANALREEILSAYDVEEREEEVNAASGGS